jgi:hypothetical protein
VLWLKGLSAKDKKRRCLADFAFRWSTFLGVEFLLFIKNGAFGILSSAVPELASAKDKGFFGRVAAKDFTGRWLAFAGPLLMFL